MALATQCPYCHTAFRVANDQLKLHAGLVRCGACQQTFNGIEHLLSPGQATVALVAPPVVPANAEAATQVAPAVAQAVATTPATVTSSAAPTVSVSTQTNAAHLASASALEFDMGEFELNKQAELAAELEVDAEAAAKPDAEASSSHELALDAEVHDLELEIRSTLMNQEDADWSINTDPKSESEFELASAAAITEQARNESALERKEPHFTSDESEQSADNESTSDELNPDSANDNDNNDDENHLEKPDFVVKAEKQKNRSRAIRYLMLFFSFLLLLSLLAQSTYSARDMIAAWFPQTKPTLQKLCVTLHCQIALPSQIDMITIESNELEALETGSKVFSLALQLQNKSSTLQNWPMLELILNDAKGKVLVQKAFPPSEYLSNKEDISKGFGAGSEQTVKLFFESTAGKASAYHVGVFYP
ncbi:DUF3426 domain-containing protein [Undibacterium sp.]|uniref:DUF3426 domain-containing protein n=1 Tax=Undibacterium sp. TaxID=1914977 RepID=UPI0025CBED6F|nr:DUF3426 domain-containing protein [Undibacterium sp.]